MGPAAGRGLRRGPRPNPRHGAGLTLAGPTTFHLVRHAAHTLLPHTLAGRMSGVGLSPEGQGQAHALAARLAALPIAAVVASPLERAQETAQPIAARLGLLVETDAGFNEIDYGAWTGKTYDELAPDPAWQAWNAERSTAVCPGGETMDDAQARALQSLIRLLSAYPEQQVVIVSHGDILKSLLAPVLGLSLDHLHRLTIDPASISTLLLFDDDMRIDGINR